MWSRLRRAATRGYAAMRERAAGWASRASPRDVRHEDDHGTDARARFWAGVREGQREAEANCTRRRGQ